MKDKFSLAKSIYYIGIINYLGDYITKTDEDGYKSIYFGAGLKVRAIHKIYEGSYDDALIESYSGESMQYIKGVNPKNKQLIDGVIVSIEKDNVEKGKIYIGKEKTFIPNLSLEEKSNFIEYMIKKDNMLKGGFIELPTNKELDFSIEDQKEIYYQSMDMIRWFDNRTLEAKTLKKQ